jgi:hypothetical protein
MSKYDPEYSRAWYQKNRERLLSIRRAYNKEYSARPEVIEKARIKNARPDQRKKRKLYKKSPAGKECERKRRSRPHIKLKYENWRLVGRYGITVEQYQKMYVQQNGRCAICDREDSNTLHIDHNHKTGKVRGLLCGACNRGIGMFGDNKDLLMNAMEYLDNE